METLRHRSAEYNASREALFQLEREGKVYVIAPSDTLGCSRTEKNLDILRALWQQGYFLGRDALEDVRALWS